MAHLTIRLSREIDEALQAVLPVELRGPRKAEIRVATALREFLAVAEQPAGEKKKARRKAS